MYNLDELVLHDLSIEQAKRTPHAVAVIDGETNVQLTFQQLDEITDLLAVQLVEEYNVRTDSVVGILLPRGVQYVIANVAILKAGGAYMPLELVYPKPLLERAIKETKANVVFTNAQYVNRVQDQTHIVMMDEYPFVKPYENPNGYSYPPPSYVHPKPDDLAFCVMSSGTTGTPKGILQTHRAAVFSYLDRRNRFPYHVNEKGDIDDRVGVGVFFVWELFRPLSFGGTCVTIPDNVLYDPHAVTKFVKDFNITRFLVTPSLIQLILDTLTPEQVQDRMGHLRILWFCGEVVSRDLALACAQVMPTTELLNLYSISECHDVSIGDLKRELDLSRKYATCGKAIPGVKFYIVDLEENAEGTATSSNTMKLVPDGETGEVYVGGPVVGRGYLNMPEKTAERFVPNVFDDDPTCARLYKTGDLGRVLPSPDGDDAQQLEVLGRCDFMVKIRGYSVVLGAVETALAKHPKLLSSVVLAIGSEGSRDKKLVAYVVPAEWKDPPSASSVRTFLKDHLPPYAIPSTFCVIDALPVSMTSAGKVDRKQLPKPETAKRLRAFSDDMTTTATEVQKTSRLAPQNHTEQAILKIWCDLLDLPAEDLSALDSFFEVGGHSLLATKLVNEVNQHFGRTTENGLSILSVVEGPSIREMADFLLKSKNADDEARAQIDLEMEASTLDPSIYPFPTRKGNTMARFRIESSALLSPRVVFLTGGTGFLGAHILANLLQIPGLTTVCLTRAKNDEEAKERLVQTMEKYQLMQPTLRSLRAADQENSMAEDNTCSDGKEDLLDSHLIAVAGDLSKPLLGMTELQFKSLAVEIDSIIHCGAEVNLIKPYRSLKESNVLGTQEVLRLATTNGFIKTKVKPVHYISTNGIFPVDADAYHRDNKSSPIVHLKENCDLGNYAPFLAEGYAMSKWVAERMCEVAESRGLPISVLRPGNMAGSSQTGVSNHDDLNYMLIQGILESGCAPLLGTNFALDLTPVDFAAQAVTHLVVRSPHSVIGQRMHLQSPHKPVPLNQVVEWLNGMGYSITAVTRDEWIDCIATRNEKLSSGWASFEKYFEAYTWLEMDSDNLQQALKDTPVICKALDETLLEQWFPKTETAVE